MICSVTKCLHPSCDETAGWKRIRLCRRCYELSGEPGQEPEHYAGQFLLLGLARAVAGENAVRDAREAHA